jgi:hypothetical protein
MTDTKEEVQKALDALHEELEAGKITTYEYNSRRQVLVKKRNALESGVAEAAPADTPAAAPAPASTPATDEAPADAPAEPKEPVRPAGWDDKKGKPTKTWSAGARTDDPSLRQVHAPLQKGIGDGRAVLFIFGFRKNASIDQQMLARELEGIKDDVEVLRNAGYTVVVDPQGTKTEFTDAVAGKAEGATGLVPSLVYWSAHGHADGSIDCCDGAVVTPADVDPTTVSPGLRLMIMAACYTGAHSRTWKKALGGHPLVVGWGRPVTIDKAVDFLSVNPDTETDLDDLIRRYLLVDAPLPGDQGNSFSPLSPKSGRIASLPERMQTVAAMLGARWREHPTTVEVDVPLPNGRSHYVHVFVVDSSQPYAEGEPLLGVEADVGEITQIVDPAMLLAGFSDPGVSRTALVKGETEMPRAVAQGFMPLARVRDTDLAALVYQVAAHADELEKRIFGGDLR